MFDIMGYSKDPELLLQFFSAIIQPYLNSNIVSGAANALKKCCQIFESCETFKPIIEHFNMKSLIYSAHVTFYSHELTYNPSKAIICGIYSLKNNFKSSFFDFFTFIESILRLVPHCAAIRAYRQEHYLLRAAKYMLEMGKNDLDTNEFNDFTVRIEIGFIKHLIDMIKNMQDRSKLLKELLENPVEDQFNVFKNYMDCIVFEDLDVPDGPELLDQPIKRKIEAWLMYIKAMEELEHLENLIDGEEFQVLQQELRSIKDFYGFQDRALPEMVQEEPNEV